MLDEPSNKCAKDDSMSPCLSQSGCQVKEKSPVGIHLFQDDYHTIAVWDLPFLMQKFHEDNLNRVLLGLVVVESMVFSNIPKASSTSLHVIAVT